MHARDYHIAVAYKPLAHINIREYVCVRARKTPTQDVQMLHTAADAYRTRYRQSFSDKDLDTPLC